MVIENEIRIFGPPGTGKTTTLTTLIHEECQRNGPEGVLVASFTKAAAREIAGRDLPIPQEQVGTLHALCFRLLGNPTILDKSPLLHDWNRAYPDYAFTSGKEPSLDNPYEESHSAAVAVYQDYQRYRARMLPREAWDAFTLVFAECWEAFKDNTNSVDFTDLIAQCLADAVEPVDATVGFFDEVQDFSPLELALVRKWGAGMARCYLAGDDDQCIYHFKGSTPHSFLSPEIPQAQKILLSQSYRLPRAVHSFAMTWVDTISPREPKAYAPRDADGEVKNCSGDFRNPEEWFRHLRRSLEAFHSVMVLASCSYMLDPLIDLLREEGVPFHNPFRLRDGRWNPLRHSKSQTTASDRITAFLKASDFLAGNLTDGYTWGNLWSWAEAVGSKAWVRGAKAEIKRSAKEAATGTIEPVQLLDFIDTDEALQAIAEGDLEWLEASATAEAKRRLRFALHVAKRQGMECLFHPPKLIVGTIHSVKGGQADCVYLIPDLSRSADEEWAERGEGHMSIRRVFYVGITRAKETLYLLDSVSDRNVWYG